MTSSKPTTLPLFSSDSIPVGVVERLFGTLDSGTVWIEAVRLAHEYCGAEYTCAITNTDQQHVAVRWRERDPAASGSEPSIRLLTLIAEEALRTTAISAFDRDLGGGIQLRRVLRDEGFRRVLAAPIAYGDEPRQTGLLILVWRVLDRIPTEATEHIAPLARQIARALTNAIRYGSARQECDAQAALFEQASDALLIVDAETLFVQRANQSAQRLSGYSANDLIGCSIEPLIALARGERRSLTRLRGRSRIEGALVHQAGHALPIMLAVVELREQPNLLMISLRDMSEHAHALQRMLLSERLAGMNRVTTVIAHEINNPLQALANAIQLLGRSLAPEKQARVLQMAEAEVSRLSLLVRRALDLYQPASEGRRPLGLQSLIDGVIEQIEPLATRNHVVVMSEPGVSGEWVHGIGSHLREAFLSLAQNALEAMPQGGQLTIRTRIDGAQQGQERWAIVELCDTGSGIPEAQLEQIFEPFYTTKENQAGMSLAICYSVIEHHTGHLAISSSTAGTIVRVSLPLMSSVEAA